MQKLVILAAALLLLWALGPVRAFAQPTGPGYGYGPQEEYCPYCGGYLGPQGGSGMGYGMMGPGYGMGYGMMGPGYGMGYGMMGPGYGMGYGMMGRGYYGTGPGMMGYGHGPQYGPQQGPVDEKEARKYVEDYLQSTGNPNLKLGKIEDKGNYFEAEIQTKNGDPVDKIIIDKRTGMMGPGYGQGYGYGRGYGYGMMGPGYGRGHGYGMMGPGYGMGYGMMGRGYYGMGPGMMYRGWGMGPGYGSPNAPGYQAPPYRSQEKPVDEQEAKTMLDNYLRSTRNPNLTLGKIQDKGNEFEADILTKKGDLVDKIIIDKKTGRMHSAY